MELMKDQRILLVDDDPSIRLSLSYFFRKKCGSFMGLKTAELALDHLRTEPYDIILCDYRLPGMDGLAFFQELQHFDLPALKILITAFGNLELAIEAIKIGVHDFILKPFNALQVEQSLTRLMEKQNKTPRTPADGKTPEAILQEAQANQKSMAKFIHQLNNFLQRMLGNAELGLLELEEEHPVRENFDDIIKDIEQLIKMIKEMDSAKIIPESKVKLSNVVSRVGIDKRL